MADYNKKLPPVHPGEILLHEFLIPFEISQYRLAKDIAVPPRRINEIVLGKRGITADTAVRLAAFFDVSPLFWMNLQVRYDIERAEEELVHVVAESIQPYVSTRRSHKR
ncbi:MAG: HigA family addiction module antidote protein [Ignavibacteriae bacterium]|nr:HigA family addiction module antidote protein [Ignavibacteriota bacterium]